MPPDRSEDPPPHHGSGRFRNPWPGDVPAGAADFIRWQFIRRVRQQISDRPDFELFQPVEPSFDLPRASVDELTLTWVGHSSFLLQIGGLNVLTDPMWSDRASPLAFAGPRRWVLPGIAFDALPPIDLVLVSHDHYDHLDDATVRRIVDTWPDARWICPLALGDWLRKRGTHLVTELDWWSSTTVGNATVTAAPARHFSARTVWGRGRTLWCSFALESGGNRVYFAGDTAHHPDFEQIAERLGPFDLMLLPIGAYEPRWFMESVHMNPEDAVRAYQQLVAGGRRAGRGSAAELFAATHWGTFRLTDEPMDEPPRRARSAWRSSKLPDDRLWILAHGETRRHTMTRG